MKNEIKKKEFLLNCSKLFADEKKVSQIILDDNKKLQAEVEKLKHQIKSI